MSSRVAGAGLALIAAALFAVSIATPVVVPAELSLFAGHPKVSGRTLEMQDVYVGFYGAQLCNTGGDGTCKRREPKKTFQITAFAELGASGLLGVNAVMLALLTLRRSERRKGVARVVRLLAVLAAGGAGALVVLGPTDQGAIPIGIGMGIYGAAVVGAFLASLIAVRPPAPIKLRVAHRTPQPAAVPPAPQPIDIQALFGEDQLRPAELGPEPVLRRDSRVRPEVPPSPREPDDAADQFAPAFAPPFGQPGQPAAEKPLFSSAPQLRPLYDAAPVQGGTGGLLPLERPVMPTRPPTPLPRAAISAVAGIPTPPPFPAERPKTLPPPNFGARGKPASIPPPLPPGPSPRTQVSLVPPIPAPDVPSAPPAGHVPPPTDLPFAHAPTQPAPFPPPAPPPLAQAATLPVPVAPPVRDAPPPASDGSPEAAESPPNTEPVPFAHIETPLAPPPMPVTPTPRPRAETPLAPPPPPVAPAPRPRRESKPLPRPQRDTQSPQPGLRASVPMPARPARQAPGPTRPPLPPPITAPRPAIPAPIVPPSIPPIPAIPMPVIPPPSNRAETDPEERASTSQFVDPSDSRAPSEVGDSTSPTNLSFGLVTAEEVDASLDDIGAVPSRERDVPRQPERGASENASSGEPIDSTDPTDQRHREVSSTEVNPVVAPAPAGLPALPLAIPLASPAMAPPTRDRSMPKLPISTAPDSLPPPKDNKEQTGPSPACPQCESPMNWVEEHLRFYCKSCRMYF